MAEALRQWPDNICSGAIRYGRADNYDGFYLADAMHGIPTFGSVTPTDPPTIRGHHVRVFNYSGQTEAIAQELVRRWNAYDDLVKALELSRAAMLRTRTASIAGCEEGYGKPEKWSDELFRSHGDLTAAIKAIDLAISSTRRQETKP